MAKIIAPDLANSHLQHRGVKLGVWNDLEAISPESNYIQSFFCTGKSVYELVNFSQHVAGWLARGRWKILQIDNSSHVFEDQSLLLSLLLLGPSQHESFTQNRTFLFEFGENKQENLQTEILLAHLINLMLIYESHCYLISSEGSLGEMLGIQDGFIYFYGNSERLAEAKKLLNDFEASPSKAAQWINSLSAENLK